MNFLTILLCLNWLSISLIVCNCHVIYPDFGIALKAFALKQLSTSFSVGVSHALKLETEAPEDEDAYTCCLEVGEESASRFACKRTSWKISNVPVYCKRCVTVFDVTRKSYTFTCFGSNPHEPKTVLWLNGFAPDDRLKATILEDPARENSWFDASDGEGNEKKVFVCHKKKPHIYDEELGIGTCNTIRYEETPTLENEAKRRDKAADSLVDSGAMDELTRRLKQLPKGVAANDKNNNNDNVENDGKKDDDNYARGDAAGVVRVKAGKNDARVTSSERRRGQSENVDAISKTDSKERKKDVENVESKSSDGDREGGKKMSTAMKGKDKRDDAGKGKEKPKVGADDADGGKKKTEEDKGDGKGEGGCGAGCIGLVIFCLILSFLIVLALLYHFCVDDLYCLMWLPCSTGRDDPPPARPAKKSTNKNKNATRDKKKSTVATTAATTTAPSRKTAATKRTMENEKKPKQLPETQNLLEAEEGRSKEWFISRSQSVP